MTINLHSNDFELWGLETQFAQDASFLEARWKALQAEVHPDRFVAQGKAAQRLAMQWSVRVNEAYHRLKDPLRRAAYLCELRGHPLQSNAHSPMPTDFLMQQMAWHETLAACLTGGVESEPSLQPTTPKSDNKDLLQLKQEVQASHEEALSSLAHFLDEAPDTPQAVQWLRRLMFLDRLLQDLRRYGADGASGPDRIQRIN